MPTVYDDKEDVQKGGYDEHSKDNPASQEFRDRRAANNSYRSGEPAQTGAAEDSRSLEDREREASGSTHGGNFGTPANLRDKEDSEKEKSGGFYNGLADQNNGKLSSLVGKAKKAKSKKGLIVGLALGGGGGFTLLVFIFILSASLAIPNLAQNIANYQFAKVTRAYMRNAQRISTQSMALQGANEEAYDAKKASTTSPRAAKALERLDNMQPDKIGTNLKTTGSIQYEYSKSINPLRPNRLTAITIDGQRIDMPKQGPSKYVPVVGKLVNIKNQVGMLTAVDDVLRSRDAGTNVRASYSKDIRKRLGIKLFAWETAKFKNAKNAESARRILARQKAGAINRPVSPDIATTQDIEEARKQAEQAQNDDLADPRKLDETIKHKGISSGVRESIGKTLEGSGLKTAAGALGTFYAIAQPLCTIYDGSIEHSGGTIDNQSKQQMAAYQYIQSADSQQRYGGDDPGLTTAVQASNEDLGDITQSAAYQRASNTNPDTKSMQSPQASAGGQYTLLDAILPPGGADLLNSIADTACPTITRVDVGIATAVVSLAVGFFTGGTTKGGEEVAKIAVEKIVVKATGKIVERQLLKSSEKTVSKRFASFVGKQVRDAGALAATTVLAKVIVTSKSGALNSGSAQEEDLANAADSGGNLMANETTRQGQYGRTMTPSEGSNTNQEDLQFVRANMAKESAYNRYISTQNPNSLIARTALTFRASMSGSLAGIFTKLGNTVFNPSAISTSLLNTFSSSASAAMVTSNYNNVGFGWPESEEKLIDGNNSYTEMDNAAILDQRSAEVGQIEKKYSKCFTETMGTLLSIGAIHRNENGDVVEGGDADDDNKTNCSPSQLGVNNPIYGNLVFRWRLDKRYQAGHTELEGMQKPTKNSSDSSDTTGKNAIGADGYTFPLQTTKRVLSVGSSDDGGPAVWCSAATTNCHHNYNAADIFAPTNTIEVAIHDGEVVYTNDNGPGNTGNSIAIKSSPDKDGKSYIFYYGHMLGGSIKVTQGQQLKAGDIVGLVGTSADADGTQPHLHIDAQLAPPATTREGCKDAACAQPPFDFIDIQGLLHTAFQGLPE